MHKKYIVLTLMIECVQYITVKKKTKITKNKTNNAKTINALLFGAIAIKLDIFCLLWEYTYDLIIWYITCRIKPKKNVYGLWFKY